jgi:hypothetical protein
METNFESQRRFNDNNKEGKGETKKKKRFADSFGMTLISLI